jgi:opacity protein-like surface antigen
MMRALLIAIVTLVTASTARAAASAPETGIEVGARTGYGFSSGNLGAPPNGTDQNVSNYVSGQWPLWLDGGYRFSPEVYLGAFFTYGFGVVNDDRQDLCRNANVNCSASDVRVGLMGRYTFTVPWALAPWLGLGVGYEWGSFSLRQTVIGNTNTDSSWSGWEFANIQAGADYRVTPQFAVAPFFSMSIGQFGSTSTTNTTGSTTNTTEQDLEKTSIHQWFLFGLRASFTP